MRRIIFSTVILAVLALSSCEFKAETKTSSESSEPPKTASQAASSKIRNGIELNASGKMKVEQAFLLFEDGTLVPESNQTQVNKPVNLRLIVDGFTEANGKVEIGASEKISTNNGDVFLDEKDLFTTLGEIEPERAKMLTLKATITRLDKLYDYFVVSFRVWDKKGDGDVTGAYKLYIQ